MSSLITHGTWIILVLVFDIDLRSPPNLRRKPLASEAPKPSRSTSRQARRLGTTARRGSSAGQLFERGCGVGLPLMYIDLMEKGRKLPFFPGLARLPGAAASLGQASGAKAGDPVWRGNMFTGS